jgi:hypothetical protein
LSLAFANVASATTHLIVGEYSGSAPINVTQTDGNGKNISYVNSCNMAYNLRLSPTSLHIDFGVVQCNRGLDTWNEKEVSLKISEGKLLTKAGVQVGTISNDGTAEFTVSNFTTETKLVAHHYHDQECAVSDVENQKFNVGSLIAYKISKTATGSFAMTREEQRSEVVTTFGKEYKDCDSSAQYKLAQKSIDFNVTLSK